jgi:hypothetical protein
MGKPSNTCKLCYKKFKHSKGMKTHILLAHKADQEFIGREIQDSELKYACNLCPRKFVKETILQKHNLEHEAQNHEYLRADCFFKDRKGCRYVCKLCYRKLSTFESLVGHILKNHGSHEKFFRISIKQQDCIYPCKRCNLKFISKDILEYHREIKHQAGKLKTTTKSSGSYKCQQCEEGFRWHVSLQEHSLTVHKIKMQEEEKPNQRCQLCFKQFSGRGNYKNHVHNIHRKYPEEMATLRAIVKGKPTSLLFETRCKFCPKSFLNLHVLNYHVSSDHKQEKNSQDWTCEFCKHVIKPNKNKSTQIKLHLRNVHQMSSESSLSSQIVQPKEDETLRNFNILMERLMGGSKIPAHV